MEVRTRLRCTDQRSSKITSEFPALSTALSAQTGDRFPRKDTKHEEIFICKYSVNTWGPKFFFALYCAIGQVERNYVIKCNSAASHSIDVHVTEHLASTLLNRLTKFTGICTPDELHLKLLLSASHPTPECGQAENTALLQFDLFRTSARTHRAHSRRQH